MTIKNEEAATKEQKRVWQGSNVKSCVRLGR